MQLDQAVVTQLSNPLWKVWNYIAADCYEMCEGDNEIAMEMCIDANRLSTCVDEPVAEALVMSLIKEHGYPKVLKFLSKNFRYV
jgi:hypothetical protein